MPVELKLSKNNWTAKDKFKRAMWECVYALIWPRFFRFLSPLRVCLLRAFGAQIDGPVLIMDRVRVWMPWNLQMGPYSTIGSSCEIYNFGKVAIGSNTVVSQRVYLCTASHDYERKDMPLFWKSIEIGDEVWIAAECFVAPGVKIGGGAVIGARSVVTKNIEPWTVNAGVPCAFIKKRILR